MQPFYDVVRAKFGKLNAAQVAGLEAILAASARLPIRHRAYVLATAWHETGQFKYASEIWGPTKQQLKYEPPSAKARDLGNSMKGDGYRFRGRGFVQLTGRANYAKASDLVGMDLVANPDRVKEPEIAALIIVSGMSRGWFTGVQMAHCKTFKTMRSTVNGTDKADLIAGYAETFLTALAAAPATAAPPVTTAPVLPKPAPVPPSAPPPATAPVAKPAGFWAWLLSLFTNPAA